MVEHSSNELSKSIKMSCTDCRLSILLTLLTLKLWAKAFQSFLLSPICSSTENPSNNGGDAVKFGL